MNNSTNIRKNYKTFLVMSIGARRSCLRKKSGEDKARDALFLTKSSSYGTRSQEEFLPSENADLANLATI
jgi:hypothetical protein